MTEEVKLTPEQEEMNSIKERLDLMSVKYHHNANLKTLKTLLNDSLKGDEPKVASGGVKENARAEARKAALKLVRCAIHCNNVGKRQMKGEFVSTGNSLLGHKTYFVPYNCPEAEDYVLPMIVVDALRQRRYLSKTEEMVHDTHARSFYMAPEFTISILGDA